MSRPALDDGLLGWLRGGVGDLLVAARRRFGLAALVLVVAWAVAFAFAEQLALVLARPLLAAWSGRAATEPLGPARLHFRSLLEPFWTYLDLSFWVALVVAVPVLGLALWQILAPRLPPRHRRLGIPFATVTGVCFAGGVVFGYLVVLPMTFDFLLSYAAHNLAAMNDGLATAVSLKPALYLEPYLELTMRMLIAFGVVFELPVVLSLLAWLGVVDHRGLLRFGRWAIVIAFVVAAVLTPGPDLISQVLMALPLCALYFLSIGLAYLIGRQRQRSSQADR